jgi:hypothetical protein
MNPQQRTLIEEAAARSIVLEGEMTAAEAAEHGEAWLDENFPSWPRAIERASFAIADAGNCVLAQVYGAGYFGAIADMSLESYQVAWLGFNISPNTPQLASPDEAEASADQWYRQLQFAWEDIFDKRGIR